MKIEKILKSGLLMIVAGIMSATASAQSSTQEVLRYLGTQDTIKVGDTVMISRECMRYETRERIIRWAYDKKHVVRQVNSKHHPNAILLKRIYSWIPSHAAMFLSRGPVDESKTTNSPIVYTYRRETQKGEVVDLSQDLFSYVISVYRVNTQTQEEELIDVIVKDSICHPCGTKLRKGDKNAKREAKRIAKENAKRERDSLKRAQDSIRIASINRYFENDSIEKARLDSLKNAGKGSKLARKQERDSLKRAQDSIRRVHIIEYFRQDSIAHALQDSLTAVQDSLAQSLKDSLKNARQEKLDSMHNSQFDRFSIGLRGGFASTMAQPFEGLKMPLGYDARLDLQYAHYWPTGGKKAHVGILTGASAGYMNVGRQMSWRGQSEYKDQYKESLIYNITADTIIESMTELQVEVPLMFSVITTGGFYFNIGPRFLLPIQTQYHQNISGVNVEVTDVKAGVAVNNSHVYGLLSKDQMNLSCQGENKFVLNVMVGMELGGEIKLGDSGHTLGLGVYANWGVYNTYYGLYDFKGNTVKATDPIYVKSVPTSEKVGKLEVKPLSESITNLAGHLDAGLKLSFNFNFIK